MNGYVVFVLFAVGSLLFIGWMTQWEVYSELPIMWRALLNRK